VLVAAGADVDPATAAAIVSWPALEARERAADRVLAATDLRHPVFRAFGPAAANLGQVRFDRTWDITEAGGDVAARFTDGSPAVVERRGASRALVFASDLDSAWNDFPLHPGFVPFVVEAVRYVAGDGWGRREYLVADVPAGIRPVPGTYAAGEDGRRIVVNVDPAESSTPVMQPDEFTRMLRGSDTTAPGVQARRGEVLEARQGLWRYGLMLMLAALVMESVVGRAR
jgi:hypothetical protein